MDDIRTNEEEEVTIDLKNVMSDIWRGFVKFWWIGVLLALLLGGYQFYKSYIRYVPMYRATATYTVHTQTSANTTDKGVDSYSFYYNRNTADQLQKVFPYVVGNELLQDQVCADLQLPYMPASVSASVLPGSNMITLTTRGRDPQLTYDVLQSVVENYDSVAEYIIGRTKLVTIRAAEVPTEPYNGLVWRNSVMKGVLLGLLLGFAWIVFYAVMRRTIRTKEEIHSELNLPCLGVLPEVIFKKHRKKINQQVMLNNPHVGSDFLEAMRMLRETVENSMGDRKKTLMITSTVPGEGKSVTTVNLAAMCAKNARRVLVIDCDLRNSGIETMLAGCEVSAVQEISDNFVVSHVEDMGFDLLRFTESKHNGRRIMQTAYMKSVLSVVQENYDLILIDTPPCGVISDAAILAGVSDGVLYVVRQDKVVRSSVRSGINALTANGGKILGCVLTGATGGLGGYGGHYSYGGYYKYYRYGYGRKQKYGYGLKDKQ